jgi:5-methylcytosine-specific restriction endonuclease McrA
MSVISKTVREQVRQRAGMRCEYCRKPEGVSQFAHTIDHIIAVKHEGTSEFDNLAWACFQCNSTKGSDIASLGLTQRSQRKAEVIK